MQRQRPLQLFVETALIFLGAMLGLTTNYVTNGQGDAPIALQIVRRWSWPLILITIVLLLGLRVWLYVAQQPRLRRVWDPERSPFPGLEAFTAADAGVFFGREPDIGSLLEHLQPSLPGRARRFIPVIGPSGSGKSSLVQAGLLPHLTKRRGRWALLPPMVPEDHPFQGLADSLGALLPETENLAELLEIDPAALARLLKQVRPGRGSVLLIVDQGEELITLTGERERTAFLDLLSDTLRNVPYLWVVFVLRSEFITPFLTSGYADLFQQPMVIGPMARSRLFEVIERPAEAAGLTFEPPSLVHRMVDDAGDGQALPLLAYVLQELYLRAGRRTTITAETYQELGGVTGALTRQADRIIAGFAPDEEAALRTLLRFVTVDESEATRRRVRRSALEDDLLPIVDAFVEARLLTSDADGDDAVIEVAHEALFREWEPLRSAIEASVESLRTRTELERSAQDWVRSGRSEAYLLHGERLAAAQHWQADNLGMAAELPQVRELVENSLRADQTAMARLADSIAARALASLPENPEQALLLALAAVERCTPTPAARQALASVVAAARLRGSLRGHEDGVWDVRWASDGRRLATASDDGTARIWDAMTGEQLHVLGGHDDWVEFVGWSPDGLRLASTSRDQTVRIWDARTGAELAVLRGHDDGLFGVSWSPDGTRVATASGDRTVRVWDAVRHEEISALRGHDDWVVGVAWSPDGKQIASASRDRTVRIWDAERLELTYELLGHEDQAIAVGWSPDGLRLASVGRDSTVRIWDTVSRTQIHLMRGHEAWVVALSWSPDGHWLATAARDRTVRVWDTVEGIELEVLHGHTDWAVGVSWSPDGKTLASASRDRTVGLWDVPRTVLRGHREEVSSVAWSPDGRRIASASRDRTIRLWDVEKGTVLDVLRGHDDAVWGVAWSPDGRTLASCSWDRTLRLWGNGEPRVLAGHDHWVVKVAWSPDGTRLASAARDRTIRIWDAKQGTVLNVLEGHEDQVMTVAWSPDGRRLVTGSRDTTVRIWDDGVATVLGRHDDQVSDVAWAPDGRHVASVSRDRSFRIWDTATGEQTSGSLWHDRGIAGVAWSPDGSRLATASDDQIVGMWAADGAGLGGLLGHDDQVWAVAWSPAGDRLVTGSRDRTVRIWNASLDLDTLVAAAHQRVFRELSNEEQQQLMLPE
jgi:WD40 repeat protein